MSSDTTAVSKNKKSVNIHKLTVCAVFVAIFGMVSNIPVLNSINLLPGVPFSLQPMIIAMIAYLLGLSYGITTYFTILLCTICGIPMMSSGKGGLGVFVGPTGGYIIGWVFIILLCGFYSQKIFPAFFEKDKGKKTGFVLHLLVSQAFAFVGIIFQYLCGTFVFLLSTGQPFFNFGGVFVSNIAAFLILDLAKTTIASIVFISVRRRRALKKFFG